MVHHYQLFLNTIHKDAHLVHPCNEGQKAGLTTAIFTRSDDEIFRIFCLLEAIGLIAVQLQMHRLSRSLRQLITTKSSAKSAIFL
jgi:hypothetical protein